MYQVLFFSCTILIEIYSSRGTALGVFSGVMYGVQFTPATYIQQHKTSASKNGVLHFYILSSLMICVSPLQS